MNTFHVKKEAISKQIGKLLEEVSKYSPDTPARWGLMEPMQSELSEFALKLPNLSWLNFLNELTVEEVKNVYNFCWKVGQQCGHVMSDNCTTGTWGCRISALENIINILNVENFELPTRGDLFTAYNINAIVEKIEVEYYGIWIFIKPVDENINSFSVTYDWKTIGELK